jgi:hypothetical protein
MALPIVFEGRTGVQIAGDLNAEMAALSAEVEGLNRTEGSFTSKRCAYLKTATMTNDAAGYTYQHIIAAEAAFNLVRIGFLNGETSAVTISKVIAGVRGSITTGAASWVNVTFGGSASVALPARLGTNRPSVTWSDWIAVASTARNDGLGSALPLFYIRSLVAAAQGSFSATPVGDDLTWLASGSPASANGGRVWKTERQNVDAVNTPANWTAPTAVGHTLPVVVEFAHTVKGVTVLNVGDSIRLGSPSDSTSITNGDAFQAAVALSTPSKPVSLVQAAWGGDNSENFTGRAADLISALRPDVVLYCPFTLNDGTPVDYRAAWQAGRMSQLLQAAKAAGAKVVAVNGMCNTEGAWNATADGARLALNATLATLGIPLVDQNSVASDFATPERFKSGASTDGRHPNASIYVALTSLTEAEIERVI